MCCLFISCTGRLRKTPKIKACKLGEVRRTQVRRSDKERRTTPIFVRPSGAVVFCSGMCCLFISCTGRLCKTTKIKACKLGEVRRTQVRRSDEERRTTPIFVRPSGAAVFCSGMCCLFISCTGRLCKTPKIKACKLGEVRRTQVRRSDEERRTTPSLGVLHNLPRTWCWEGIAQSPETPPKSADRPAWPARRARCPGRSSQGERPAQPPSPRRR